MTDTTQPRSSKALVVSLSVFLIVVAIIAALFVYKWNESQETVNALSAQLEDSEKQIAELQPLANKARQLPIVLRIDRHAINAGYNLFIFNRSRDSLHFKCSLQVLGRNRQRIYTIDGGKFAIFPGLATGDTVQIESDGYDPKTVTIN